MICENCRGKCCRDIDTGYQVQHYGAEVFMHVCDYCTDGEVPEASNPSSWYECARCDAGYDDQQCTCKSNPELVEQVPDDFAASKGIRWNPRMMLAALHEENAFLVQERERLIKKLEEIEKISLHAWTTVKTSPDEAESLFKLINRMSK